MAREKDWIEKATKRSGLKTTAEREWYYPNGCKRHKDCDCRGLR